MNTGEPPDPATLTATHPVTTDGYRLLDPFGMFGPILRAQLAWWSHPAALSDLWTHVLSDALALEAHSLARLAGSDSPDLVAARPDDARFHDPAWDKQPVWSVLKQWYLFYTRTVHDAMLDAPGLPEPEARRAAFWSRQWLNAAAPTNFLLTNPVALQRALESDGESLRNGFTNFLKDIEAGTIRMADDNAFAVGRNLAITPGAVIFRNSLFELIHYAPTATRVHTTPLVIITPCINKFYVLDLQPHKSLVKYLLDRGFDVYITSWKNPDATMRDTEFADYVVRGVGEAVRVARELSGTDRVHAVGYCIGGTLLSAYMAWAAGSLPPEDQPVAHWTLLATLVDFRAPGDIEVFIDKASVNALADRMRTRGYLDGAEMATTFRLLRSNSLVWHYLVHGWLYGEVPPPSDILYWNMDSTRMAARMHEFYLRELYLQNNLCKSNALTIDGVPIDLGAVRAPLYQVSAEDDHITPWRETFRTVGHVSGEARFVLTSSGHILGIVNPPVVPPKRHFRAAPVKAHSDADQWLACTQQQTGTWWEDWSTYLAARCGALRAPPEVSTIAFPALATAPGTYVLER